MNPHLFFSALLAVALPAFELPAQNPDDFPLTEDSKPQANVAKGQMIKDTYMAKADSVFPGTEREYQIYLPAELDASKPAPFMVFQDGVIYQAPVVFDNLIARKEIPPLIGIFIRPGVVPAANENALPRFNRSYEYDSVTDTYARFLIDEFLPAVKAKHPLNLSDDPNARAISGNSSGGICAFMVAWHRPDQFRRVFTGVGTYVGIHGADQLPVLVRKYEPKPLRVFLQSGENDNNLYCGDWWMANQMMERSLTWSGYEVNHAWGKGGHSAKHASQIFPEVLRWLWKSFPNEPVKANPRGNSNWRGYEVIGDGEWENVWSDDRHPTWEPGKLFRRSTSTISMTSSSDGLIYFAARGDGSVQVIRGGEVKSFSTEIGKAAEIYDLSVGQNGILNLIYHDGTEFFGLATIDPQGKLQKSKARILGEHFSLSYSGEIISTHTKPVTSDSPLGLCISKQQNVESRFLPFELGTIGVPYEITMCPDQTQVYLTDSFGRHIWAVRVQSDHSLTAPQRFGELDRPVSDVTQAGAGGMCVDTNGWLYVATSLGIQALDQAGRVNFIIPTPKQPHDVCFGGKDLSELFIACGDTIYKRPTKAKGYISGQMAPIKPPAPKL